MGGVIRAGRSALPKVLLPVVAISLALAACGGDDAEPTVGGPAASAGAAADANDADVLFAQRMIPHHEQAVEMAALALDPTIGASPRIVDLATRIRDAQDPEIRTMTAWLEEWGASMPMDLDDGHDMSGMEGMMSVDQMDALAAARSTAFDQLWAELMIAHHEGAIAMAEDVRDGGANPEVQALAGAIIEAQRREVEELRQLLGR